MPNIWKGSIHFSSYYFTIIITDTITHSQNLSHLSICKLDYKIPEGKNLTLHTPTYSRTVFYTVQVLLTNVDCLFFLFDSSIHFANIYHQQWSPVRGHELCHILMSGLDL